MVEQQLLDYETVVGISYTKLTNYFQLWKEKNDNRTWIEAEVCRQAKPLIVEKQPNRWTAGLLQLSR